MTTMTTVSDIWPYCPVEYLFLRVILFMPLVAACVFKLHSLLFCVGSAGNAHLRIQRPTICAEETLRRENDGKMYNL